MINIGISASKAPFLENFGIFKEKNLLGAYWIGSDHPASPMKRASEGER